MSLINKFSVAYNLEKANQRQKEIEQNEEEKKLSYRSDALSDEVATSLIKLGYDIETLMTLIKYHPYQSVEEALNLLSKDDMGKYHHKFVPNKSNQCAICHEKETEHYEIIASENREGERENCSTNTHQSQTNENKVIPFLTGCKSVTGQYDYSRANLISERPNSFISLNDITVPKENEPMTMDFEEPKNKPEGEQMVHFGKIQISKETLEGFSDPDICKICFANKVNPNNIAQASCQHIFCDNCIKTYLTSEIINGKVIGIKCLMAGCKRKYTEKEIKANVEPEVFLKYMKFKNEQIKLSNPNKKYIYCPYPDCDELLDVDEIDDDFPKCPKGHVFCIKCRRLGVHNNKKCQEEDVILLQQIRKGNTEGINYKQCPKCKVIIEKNKGCNQMHCINCGYDFCWICMRKYTSGHYAIYNVGGCPGMRFEEDQGSRWVRRPCLKILWYTFSCLLGFFACLSIILFYLLFGCAYEFINCYLKPKKNEETSEVDEYTENAQSLDGKDNSVQKTEPERKRKNTCLIILVGFFGILCQPLYLLFYILYGIIECYRRFNCWFYYVD